MIITKCYSTPSSNISCVIDGCEAAAVIECGAADGGDGVGDGEGCETAAALEGIIRNFRDIVTDI